MAGQRVANTPAISIIGIAYRAPGPGRPECGERHEFDHDWFGIDAHEANRMDLAQYRALEVAIEAVDDAGIGYLLRGSDTAILLAVCAGTAAFTRSTHRLAAVLDLHGPRLVLDHADPASGAAIELATNMLTETSVPFVIVIEVGRSAPALAGVRADTEPSDSITALVLQRTADASGARTLSHADIIGTASASDRERLEPEDIGVAGLDVGTDRALVRPERPVIRDAQPPVLIGVTGRDRDEVRSTAQDLVDASADRTPALSELAAAGRILPGAVRATVVTSDAEAAVSALRALARGAADSPDIAFGPGSARAGPPLLLFSGQGGQHARMGRALAARYPAFARALAEVTDAVAGAGGPRVWTPRNGFGGTTTVDTVQTSLFVYQVAMAELLAAWGIRPGAVTGHGPGEIAAAVVAGAISLTDGAALISTRARVQAAGDADAAAVMFEATAQQVRRLIEPLRTQVAVTAVNGPRAVVVSGPARYVATLMRRARRRQFRIHPVPMELAHHGPASRARAERLLAEQPAVTPRPPRIPIFATSRAGLVVEPGRGGMRWDSDYWLDNLCGTVELDDAIASAIARGFSTVVEISPRPILAAAVHARSGPIVVPAADRDDEARTFLRALGTLYVRGNDLNWSIQGPATRPLTRRNWRRAATPAAPGAVGADRPEDHIVSEADTVPASYWLLRLMDSVPAPARLRTIDLAGPIGPENLTAVEYRLGDRPRITLGTRTVASARTASPATPADILTWMRRVEAYRAQTAPAAAEVDDFYRELLARGLDHGPDFRRLTRIRTGNGCAVGEFDAAPMTSATLEGCLQLITAAADPADIAPGRSLRMDSAWIADLRRIRITEAYAFVTGRSHTDVVADVIALDQYDAPAVALLGVRMPVTSRDRCSTVSSGTAQPAANGTDVASGGLRIPFPGPVRRRRYDPTVATTPGWAASIPRVEQWIPAPAVPDLRARAAITRAVVIGDCELATELGAALSVHIPVQRITLSPNVTGMPAGVDTEAAVILVWPDSPAPDPPAAAGRALRILQQARTAPRSVIAVLRDRAGLAQSAVAAMVRTAQTESTHAIRLIWSDGFSPAVLGEAILERSADEELAIEHTTILRRGFVPAPTSDGAGVAIAADGTYVVTGALDGLGAVAARWLLDRGARDIVLLTAIPRPLPPLLDGCEDRVVVMHCDIADPADLDTALTDIRACGSTIRGLIHTDGPAPVTDTPLIETPPNETFTEVSADQVIQRIEAARSAIGALLAATACDGLDFTLLFSSMAAALGVPGRTGAAAAHSVLDTMARTSGERRVTSIAWGSWDYGLTRSDDAAARMRSAGITAFDAARGMAVLSAVLQRPEPVLLAVDYHPGEYTSADSSGDTARLARRLRQLWQAATPELSVTAE